MCAHAWMYVSVCVFERDTQGEQGEGREREERAHKAGFKYR